MKKSRILVVLMLGAIVSSCALMRPRIGHKVYASKEFHRLGERLPAWITKNVSRELTLARSSQFWTSYDLVIHGIRYTYGIDCENGMRKCINAGGIIRYIATSDPNFRTSGGFSIRSTYRDLPAELKAGLQCEPQWAYYLSLDDEWMAGFCIGHYWTERPPRDGDRISFFFQRK